MNIEILNKPSEIEPFLVINKPSGLPSAPLKNLEEDCALTQAIKFYPEILQIKGKKEIEYGLLHRLDTVTSGLLLIALNQEFYDYLQMIQNENRFIKTYYAICDIDSSKQEGFPEFPYKIELVKNFSITIESFFRSYGKGKKEVRPVIGNSNSYADKKANLSKKYYTNIKIISTNYKQCSIECQITQGFRHQVRNHLAWCGLPIKGDTLYNKNSKETEIKFYAIGLDFEYKGKKFSFRSEKD